MAFTESLEALGGIKHFQGSGIPAALVPWTNILVQTLQRNPSSGQLAVAPEELKGMQPGTVILDMAAQYGGNCEVTKAGETVMQNGVAVIGPVNLPATVPGHASQMYSRNLVTFLKNMMTKEGALNIDTNDEITRDTLVVRDGQIVNARVQELLGVAAS